jgi:hypothetical protein
MQATTKSTSTSFQVHLSVDLHFKRHFPSSSPTETFPLFPVSITLMPRQLTYLQTRLPLLILLFPPTNIQVLSSDKTSNTKNATSSSYT